MSNPGPAAVLNGVLTDALADGLLLDPTSVVAGRGTIKLENSRLTITLGTINAGEEIAVTFKASVIGAAGAVLANSATLTYSGQPGLRSNTVETMIVGFGTPKPLPPTATTGVTGKGTPVAVGTPGKQPTAAPTRTKAPGVTTPGNGTVPTTGGEFPLFSGLGLLFLALVLRQLRLRRLAAQA